MQGLRAVAVLLVLLDHVFGKPRGGFVGVDIFFAISGFLITGILIREQESSGRTSIRDFYKRRARRILPMSVFVLVTTTLVARWLFLSVRAHQTFVDALWSAGFLANVHFTQLGTSYFDATRPPSAVQHFWSLAVEEQFYVVWPLAILLACLVFKKAKRPNPRAVVTGIAVTMIVVSFAFSVTYTRSNPASSYFSAGTRAWELGIGALAAALYPSLSKLDRRARLAAVWLGAVGVVASAFVIGPTTEFPGSAALLPVLATTLILGFGPVRGGVGERWALGAAPLQGIGDISYSLYLWHWPAVIFATAYFGKGTTKAYIAAVGGAFVLSVLTYNLIENPFRHSYLPWNKPRAGRRRSVSEWVFDNERVAVPVALVAILAVLAAGVFTTRTSTPAARQLAAVDVGSTATTALAAPTATEVLDPLAALIRDSAAATSWGTLSPSLDSLTDAAAPEWTHDKCINIDASNEARCVYGSANAPHLAVLVGDSVALSYMPGLRLALAERGWRIQVLTFYLCPMVDTPTRSQLASKEPNTKCIDHRAWALNEINRLQPELVIASSSASSILKMVNAPPAGSAESYTRWTEATSRMLGMLGSPARRVALIGGPPGSGNLQECVTVNSKPSACAKPLTLATRGLVAAESRAAQAAGATYVDPLAWFCFQNVCPAVIGSTPVYWDGGHLTAAYARSLAPQLAKALGV